MPVSSFGITRNGARHKEAGRDEARRRLEIYTGIGERERTLSTKESSGEEKVEEVEGAGQVRTGLASHAPNTYTVPHVIALLVRIAAAVSSLSLRRVSSTHHVSSSRWTSRWLRLVTPILVH